MYLSLGLFETLNTSYCFMIRAYLHIRAFGKSVIVFLIFFINKSLASKRTSQARLTFFSRAFIIKVGRQKRK